MSKKIVIAGSATLQAEIKDWLEYWNNQNNCIVSDYPKAIDPADFIKQYPQIHTSFFKNISEADILFVANEDKNNIVGYIGAETFAEMAFAVAQNLLYNKKIDIVLAKMPSNNVQSFNEIELWLKLGWIRILEE